MLTCAFGSPWTSVGCGPCAQCQAALDEACARFEQGVRDGRWDDRGYTPREAAKRDAKRVV